MEGDYSPQGFGKGFRGGYGGTASEGRGGKGSDGHPGCEDQGVGGSSSRDEGLHSEAEQVSGQSCGGLFAANSRTFVYQVPPHCRLIRVRR